MTVCTDISEEASWNYAVNITEKEWKSVGLGGQKYDTIVHPHSNSFRDHSGSIAEMCKKELQKLLPILVYDETLCRIVFKVIEDI